MLIWLAYFAIPVVLASFFWPRRRSLPYRAVLWLFAAFILGCGLTHLLEAVTFYRPVYRLSGLIKLATALVSWATVIALVPVARTVAGLEWSGHPMPPRSADVERRHPWRNPYAVAVLAIVLATIARLGLSPLLGQQSPFLTYFMAVMAVAGYGGFGPSLLAVLLGGASAWYLFLGTPGSWDVGGVEGTLGLGLYLFVGATTGLMAESLRAARRRAEANTLELLEQRRALEDEVARREQAQADLKMVNATLEGRVAERTAQLEGRARELADLNERLQQEVGERQQVEGRLRDANRELDRVSSRLHGIMEGTPDLIAALDPDFRFLDFNRAYRDEFEKIFGSRIEAGTSLVEALAHLPGEQASAVEIWSRALRGESFTVTREFGDERRERKCYEIVYSPIRDEAGQFIGAAHVVRDVTDRQRAEAAVATSRALFEALFESAPDAITVVDQEGRVVRLNRQAEALFGFRREELLGQAVEVLIPERFRPRHVEHRRRFLAAPAVRPMGTGLHLYALRKDGSEFPVDATLGPVDLPDGRVVLSTVRDITDRRRAEEALAAQAAKLREQAELLDLTHDTVLVRDPAGHIIFWNRGAQEMYGWSPEEACGQSSHVLLRTRFPRPLAEIDQELEQTGRWEGVLVHQRRDGTSVVVASRWALKRDAQDRLSAVLEINNDITEQQRAEEALRRAHDELELRVRERTAELTTANEALQAEAAVRRRAEEELRRQADELRRSERREQERAQLLETVLRATPTPIWISHDRECREITGNPASFKFLKTSEDSIISATAPGDLSQTRTFREYRDDQPIPPHDLPLQVAAREGVEVNGAELKFVFNDGEVRHVYGNAVPLRDHEGHVQGAIAAFVDITRLKEAEEALRRSEEYFRTLADSIPQLAWTARPDGHNFWYNRRWYEYTGTTPEQMEGWGWQSVHHPAVLATVLERWRESIATGEPFDMVFPMRGADGQFRPFLTRVLPLKDEQGRVLKWFGTNTDVTDQRRIEEVLRRAQEDLEERVRERTAELQRSNRELEQFAYVASHDLQEPLRMVGSYLELLAQRYKGQLDARADKYIHYAVDGATRMQGLIQDLLAYSRVTTNARPPEPTDCTAALRTALANLHRAIEEARAEITSDPLPCVPADPTQLAQVFQNLIGNALKFCAAKPPRIHVGCARRGPDWVFSVRDNGIGIAPEHADRIFLLFQRLHQRDKYPGTGIGLAICKKVVERHGGRIWVESQPGQGSTFYFTLPSGGKGHLHDEGNGNGPSG